MSMIHVTRNANDVVTLYVDGVAVGDLQRGEATIEHWTPESVGKTLHLSRDVYPDGSVDGIKSEWCGDDGKCEKQCGGCARL